MAVPADYFSYLAVIIAFLQALIAGRIYSFMVDKYYDSNKERYSFDKPPMPKGLIDMILHTREAGSEGFDFSLMPRHSLLVEVANEYAKRDEMRWLQDKLGSTETSLKVLHRLNEPKKYLQEELIRHAARTKRAQEQATHIAERIGHRLFVTDYLTKERVARGRTKIAMKDLMKKRGYGVDTGEKKMENVDYAVSDLVDKEIRDKYYEMDMAKIATE